jgi:acetyl-CoA carboxylase biotin carboxylase subunit
VEFLLDGAQNFYFLEMNTRLQVEHPVTELVTGLDLVHLQIQIAAGEPLPFTQKDVQLRGHAIECRVYAEDPDNGFFPSPGRITRLLQPGGPGIREDSGIYEGWVVPMDYDPMLSKLVAFAPTRELAVARLLRAIDEYVITGIRTNLGLFRRILNDADFRSAAIDTGYLDRLLANGRRDGGEASNCEDIAAVAAAVFEQLRAASGSGAGNGFVNGAGNGAGRLPASAESSNHIGSSAWKAAARREGLRR